MTQNGGKPEKNTLSTEPKPVIRYFFSILYRFHPKVRTFEEINNYFCSYKDISVFFKDKLVFGDDSSGNLHCIDTKDGKVYYVPLDVGLDLEGRKVLSADCFGMFIDNLADFESVFGSDW